MVLLRFYDNEFAVVRDIHAVFSDLRTLRTTAKMYFELWLLVISCGFWVGFVFLLEKFSISKALLTQNP